MRITITAFERSPDGGMGLARDTRVRWALEEVDLHYDVRLVSFAAMKEPAHLALHPFGQIPTYEEGDLALFETGAIVFHIATHHPGLLPDDANARARAIMWMFAALSTVEPPILDLSIARIFERDKPWAAERMPLVEDRLRGRLAQLSTRLGDSEWLDGAFSAGDLMMVSVLLRSRSSGILDEYRNLAAYVARGEARPAYQRAFEAQLAVNKPTSDGAVTRSAPRHPHRDAEQEDIEIGSRGEAESAVERVDPVADPEGETRHDEDDRSAGHQPELIAPNAGGDRHARRYKQRILLEIVVSHSAVDEHRAAVLAGGRVDRLAFEAGVADRHQREEQGRGGKGVPFGRERQPLARIGNDRQAGHPMRQRDQREQHRRGSSSRADRDDLLFPVHNLAA
jgi:glutathione S-transferase